MNRDITTDKTFTEALGSMAGAENVLVNEPMSRHTTFMVGGPADFFVAPSDTASLAQIVNLCRSEEVPYYLVGNGSNLLVSDQGFRGVILSTKNLQALHVEGNEITAGPGVRMSVLSKEACRAGLAGLAFAAGIPGTVGGGVHMNAGAYDGEISKVAKCVRVLDKEAKEHVWTAQEMQFDYRSSRAMKEEAIVLETVFSLEPGDPEQIQARIDELAAKRRASQPLEFPSAGSTFKRPRGYYAGKLIQDSGLAGYRIGGACVSTKHCGFVINDQHATASDIYQLCRNIQDIVFDKYGVKLAMEVKMIGDFC